MVTAPLQRSSQFEATLIQPVIPQWSKPALFLDGWLEFNRIKWGLTAERVRFSASDADLPAVEAVYYLNEHGQIFRPPANPYSPVRFESTATQSAPRLDRQWLSAGKLLVDDMHRHGLANSLFLPPEIRDVRPWLWEGYRTTVRYTYRVDLPHCPSLLDSSIRRQINRSAKAGFSFESATSLDEVYGCMLDTQARQEFSFGLDLEDLELARSLLGTEAFRAYVCRAPDGTPAVGAIVLHQAGHNALAWLIGTKDEYLRSGATQLLIASVLDDVSAAGASGFDFVGANFPSIAAAKAFWGGYLATSYTIEAPSVKSLARHVRNYVRFRRAAL